MKLDEKEEIRNKVINSYLETVQGINIEEFIKVSAFIKEKWLRLTQMLGLSVIPNRIDRWFIQGFEYLIIEVSFWDFIVIDLKQKAILTKEQVMERFTNAFFVKNYRTVFGMDYFNFFKFTNSIGSLVDFYELNKDIFFASRFIYFCLSDWEFSSYLCIDLGTLNMQLYLKTNDDFSDFSEHWFFNGKFEPKSETIKKYVDALKGVKIPYEVIPNYFYARALIKKEIKALNQK